MRRPQGALVTIPLPPRRVLLPGVLLAGLVTTFSLTAARQGPGPAEPPPSLRKVTPHVMVFLHIDVAGLFQQAAARDLVTELLRLQGVDLADVGGTTFGVPLKEIEGFAQVTDYDEQRERDYRKSEKPSSANYLIVTTRRPIKQEVVAARVLKERREWRKEKGPDERKPQPFVFKGKTFHAIPSRRERDFKDKVKEKEFPKEKKGDKDGRFDKEKPVKKEEKDRPSGRTDPRGRKPLGQEADDFFVAQKEFKEEAPRDKGGKEKGEADEEWDRLRRQLDRWDQAVYFLDERTYVTGTADSIMLFIEQAGKPDEKHPLFAALAGASKHHVAVGLLLPEESRQWVNQRDEIWRLLRREPLGGLLLQNLRPLLVGQRFVLTLDVGEESRFAANVTFATARAARRAEESARLLLQLEKDSMSLLEETSASLLGGEEKLKGSRLAELLARFRSAWDRGQVKVEGTELRILVRAKTDSETLRAASAEVLPRVQAAANQAISRNNLQQLALAMINYADQNNSRMPPAVVHSRDGKPLYSWRVAILPQIGEEELYKKLKLNEPWDSPHNKPLLAKMPKVFEMPGIKAPEGMTYFQVFTGENTPFPEKGSSRFPASITDGTSQTIFIVEAAEPIHWAAPGDIKYSPRVSPLKQIGRHYGTGTLAAMGDGSVHLIPAAVTEATLRAAITPSADDVLGDDWGGEERRGRSRKDRAFKDKKFEEKKN